MRCYKTGMRLLGRLAREAARTHRWDRYRGLFHRAAATAEARVKPHAPKRLRSALAHADKAIIVLSSSK